MKVTADTITDEQIREMFSDPHSLAVSLASHIAAIDSSSSAVSDLLERVLRLALGAPTSEFGRLISAVFTYVGNNSGCSIDEISRQLLCSPTEVRGALGTLAAGDHVINRRGRYRVAETIVRYGAPITNQSINELYWAGDIDRQTAETALRGSSNEREAARARCAEILNARKETK